MRTVAWLDFIAAAGIAHFGKDAPAAICMIAIGLACWISSGDRERAS